MADRESIARPPRNLPSVLLPVTGDPVWLSMRTATVDVGTTATKQGNDINIVHCSSILIAWKALALGGDTITITPKFSDEKGTNFHTLKVWDESDNSIEDFAIAIATDNDIGCINIPNPGASLMQLFLIAAPTTVATDFGLWIGRSFNPHSLLQEA